MNALVIILFLVILVGGAAYAVSNSRTEYPRHQRHPDRHLRFHQSHEERKRIVISDASKLFQDRINAEDRRATRAALRGARALQRGRNPAYHMRKAAQHDEVIKTVRGQMNKSLQRHHRLHDSAKTGNAEARKLVGRVVPGTTTSIGGFGKRPLGKPKERKSLRDLIIGGKKK